MTTPETHGNALSIRTRHDTARGPTVLCPELCSYPASSLVEQIATGRISARDVVEAHIAWIAASDDVLRSFMTVTAEEARQAAAHADCRVRGGERLPLLGIPFAVKDLTATAGVRTTFGSLAYKDHVPALDELCVARLKDAGAVLLGKTNTPEFGFGARCLNPLQGPTANPHAPTLTSGGSSGGSASAVAAGQVSIAHGTDFGGSVRTPAAFCGTVAIRPTPGLIPNPSRSLPFDTLATHGVVTRTVDDASLMLSVMIGCDPYDPTSRLPGPELEPELDIRDIRVAVSTDFGFAPMASAIAEAFGEAIGVVARRLSKVTSAHPDCSGAKETFENLRAATIFHNLKHLLDTDILTPTVRWNAERGRTISAEQFLAAEASRGGLIRRFVDFFRDHDVLITPAASILPFPNTQDEVRDIDGKPVDNILDYLAVTYVVSLVGFPAIVIPAWMSPSDLPIGLQIIAPPLEEGRLIALARWLEHELGFRHQLPAICR